MFNEKHDKSDKLKYFVYPGSVVGKAFKVFT